MKGMKRHKIILVSLMFLGVYFFITSINAQTNVTLFSVSPESGSSTTPVTINGQNLFQCAPTSTRACNVQFYDSDIRRTTVSGNEVSDTRVTATVPAELCPGKYTIRVGEVSNYSNAIPFTVLQAPSAQSDPDASAFYCRYISSITPGSGPGGTNIAISGLNLHTTVHFFNSDGTSAGTATGTVVSTYDVDTGVTGIKQFISDMTVKVPMNLQSRVYKIRVGTNQIVTINTSRPIQVPDISNAVDFSVSPTLSDFTILNVRAINIGTDRATITWDTSVPADSQVEYCTGVFHCRVFSTLDTALRTQHSVQLTGLTSNKGYFFWVKSVNGAGTAKSDGYYVFRTRAVATPTPTPTLPPIAPPVISNIQVTNVTRNSAIVTWDTDKLSDSNVGRCFARRFCLFFFYRDPTLTLSHSMTLLGLNSGAIYDIKVRSRDQLKYKTTSDMLSFTTLAGLQIFNYRVTNITSTTATIIWETNYPSDSEVKLCGSRFYCWRGLVFSDSSSTQNHLVDVVGLNSDTGYYYRLRSEDSLGEAGLKGKLLYFRTLP